MIAEIKEFARIAAWASKNGAAWSPDGEEFVGPNSAHANEALEALSKTLETVPDEVLEDGEIDRDLVKAQLDAKGVKYNKRAHTDTLVSLLEESYAGEGGGEEE